MYYSNKVKILKIQITRTKYKVYQGKWYNSIAQSPTCLSIGNFFFWFRFLVIVRERESPLHQCYELQLKAIKWWKVKGEFTFVFLKKAATETTSLGRLVYITLFPLIHSNCTGILRNSSPKELINICFLFYISGRWYSTTDGPKGCSENPVSRGKRHPKCQWNETSPEGVLC